MPLWKIEPAASPDDPRWLDHEMWREVVVRAPTAALARLEAGKLESDPVVPPTGNELPSSRTAFEDEKLYQVKLLEPASADSMIENSGAPAIVHAEPLRGRGRSDDPGAP